MNHTIIASCFLLSMLAANAQEQKTNLAYHFQQRLAATAGTPAPTYAELLQVTDRIAGAAHKTSFRRCHSSLQHLNGMITN